MPTNKSKTTPTSNNKVNPRTSALTGAVIGAGVVAAGVMAIKNKHNQDKAKKIVDQIKAKASTFMHTAKDQAKLGKSKIEKTKKIATKSKKEVKKI